jgi:hypothetical protein
MTIRPPHIAVLLLATTCPELVAQHRHQGFWIGLSPGGVGTAGDHGLAYPQYLRLGGTVSQQLLIGVETFTAILDLDPPAVSGNLSLLAVAYPSPKGGLFAKAGAGLALAKAECPGTEPDDSQLGLGATLGLGYDLRLARNTYLTASGDVLLGTGERPLCPVPGQPEAAVVRDYSPGVFFTLGITWH